jgi:2-methylisocitrate lyase-like PEP mutase family enzyme
MSTQQEKATQFMSYHTPGKPVILFNGWDAGSVKAIAECGAKIVGTGGHGVAESLGYEDGENMPVTSLMENTRRIVATTDLPITIDIDGGYGESPQDVGRTVTMAIDAGVVGINFEDQFVGGEGVHDTAVQAARIMGARKAADDAQMPLFINARTDIFRFADPSEHPGMVEQAIERATAYKQAGANGFFTPGLIDLGTIQKLCAASPLPVNILKLPGSPSNSELAAAGVARISYGPFPWLNMLAWLKDQASQAYQE